MIQFLKELFCDHDYDEYHTYTNLRCTLYQTVYRCKKCEKRKYNGWIK